MRARQSRMQRHRAGDGGTHWISYSDMMASLLLIFILAIVLSIYNYYRLLETKTRELGEQQAQLDATQITLAQQEKDLETTRVQLMGKEKELSQIQIQLDTKEQDLNAATLKLSEREEENERLLAQIVLKEADLADQQNKIDALQLVLSAQEKELSSYQADVLPEAAMFAGKTDNEDVLESVSILLDAIKESRSVRFQYYDLTVTKQKRYRRNRQAYHLLPCSILSYSGRIYCVCWSDTHHSFANYRVDKMSSLLADDVWDPVPFDAERWIETSFMMYRGEPGTVTLRCDNSLTNIVFDQFGKDVMISAITPENFTVSIRTSVSPTLISWILMFYDRIEVLRPDDLIDELRKIAKTVLKTYPED